MKKIILLIVLVLTVAACTKNDGISTVNDPSIEDEIDESEYVTGEIITDGIYDYPSNEFGIIYFVPDEESSEIIKEKYNMLEESLQLKYEDKVKVENLPKELGIYKVMVNLKLEEESKWLVIEDVQLTDEIGTVTYEGKDYEMNELDENVKVKDKVCGLIIKWVSRDIEVDSTEIRFAGEIESKGYYFINFELMYGGNVGKIYFSEEDFNNIPFYREKGFDSFYFFRTNELYDELENFSSFGRGRFKTSNYTIFYNGGMGRPVSDYLTEIISLDENYRNMFNFDKDKYVDPVGINKGFIIVSSTNHDENMNLILADYYYINKNKPEKLFLFNSDSYIYELKLASNDNEFVLSSSGYNYETGVNDKEHAMIFNITESGVESQKVDELSISLDRIPDNGVSYLIQGYISDININENKVIITLSEIEMNDVLEFDSVLDDDDSVDILILDYNISGPFIKVGDEVIINCQYTKDKEFLYTLGYNIGMKPINKK